MTEHDLDDLLGKHASAHRVPGAAIGLLRDGVETFAFYGVADARTGAPVTVASRFAVGSLTKSMVATVVARLAAEGRLSLDDPVAAHVPELRGAGWAQRATVRDLLASRSGLPLRTALEFGFAADQDPDDDVLSRFATRFAAEEPTAVAWSSRIVEAIASLSSMCPPTTPRPRLNWPRTSAQRFLDVQEHRTLLSCLTPLRLLSPAPPAIR